MPKKTRHWVRLAWKKCAVSNEDIGTLEYLKSAKYGISAHGRLFFKKLIKAQGCHIVLVSTGLIVSKGRNKRTVCTPEYLFI